MDALGPKVGTPVEITGDIGAEDEPGTVVGHAIVSPSWAYGDPLRPVVLVELLLPTRIEGGQTVSIIAVAPDNLREMQ